VTVSGPERFDRPVSPPAVARHREDISQRRIYRCRLLPLLPLLHVSRHTSIRSAACSLKSFNGFSVRVDAQSDFAGAPVVGDSPPWRPARS